MDCKQTALAIESALDAGRTERPPEVAARHLAGCANCRRLWDEARAVEAGLDTWREDEPPVPAGLHRGIMAALAVAEPPRRAAVRPRPRLAARHLGLAAAALLMIGFGAHWLAVERIGAPRSAQMGAAWSIPSFSLESLDFNPADLFRQPKQDFKELAGEILAATGGLIQMEEPAPADTLTHPTPTPYGKSVL